MFSTATTLREAVKLGNDEATGSPDGGLSLIAVIDSDDLNFWASSSHLSHPTMPPSLCQV